MRPLSLLGGAVVASGLFGAGQASAQDLSDPVFASQSLLPRTANVDPLDMSMPGPELQALGVRLGNYTLRTSAEIATIINSNVRVRPNGDSGVAGYVAPTIQITSNDDRNPLTAYVSGSLALYPKQGTETVGTLSAGVDVTREIGQDVSVRAQASGGRFYEDRALSFTPNLSYRPVKFDRVDAVLSASWTPGRLVLVPSLGLNRLMYQDGLRLDDPTQRLVQRARNLVRIEPTLLAGYLLSDITSVYAAVTADRRDYDTNNRLDSHGYAVYAGVRFRPTALTRLDVALGYQRQNYAPGLTDPAGLYARVVGLYSPDRQTAIRLEYRRDISETGAVLVGGLTRDRMSFSVRREVLRNWQLTGGAELRRYDFATIDRKDFRALGWLEGRYLASRRFDLFVRAEQLVSRTSGTAGTFPDVERTSVTSGVTLKL